MVNAFHISVDEDTAVTEDVCGRWIEEKNILVETGRYPYFSVVIFPSVPDSFWQGLRECKDGHHYEMDRVLEEPPPEQ